MDSTDFRDRLFAQDIFEISKKLPNILPRSSDGAEIVVMTEHLENLEITREYTISRSRIYDALRWLVANNPLHRDVTINNNVQLIDGDVIRPTEEKNSETRSPVPKRRTLTLLLLHIIINSRFFLSF